MQVYEHPQLKDVQVYNPMMTREHDDHRRKRLNQSRPSPRSLHPVPSLSVLSILATFCADSVVAKPDCPNFLCPFPTSSLTAGTIYPYVPHPSSSHISKPQPVPKRRNDVFRRSDQSRDGPQRLPTKYSQDQDGRYRPESSWSLNGKTLTCSVSICSSHYIY